VLYLLNTSSQQFAVMIDSYKQQHRKYTNLADLSAEEIKQVCSFPYTYSTCLENLEMSGNLIANNNDDRFV